MYDVESAMHSVIKRPKIVVIGVGGAGGNILNAVMLAKLHGVSFLALNTDAQALENVDIKEKLVIGEQLTYGMGTGSNPEIGKMALEESFDHVMEKLEGVDIAFLVGGMGGGTGSGVIPVLAKMLQEKMILSIALVTKPFFFEGARRMQVAQNALTKLEEYVDTLMIIPNQKLFDDSSVQSISLKDAFEKINLVIVDCVRAVTDTIFSPGHINVDFADIKTVMSRMGRAVIGIGKASGENRALSAIQKAISSSLLENNSLKGARSILLNIAGDAEVSLYEMNIIASYVHDEVHPEAHIILGSSMNLRSEASDLTVTIIATGFEDMMKTRMNNKNMLHNNQQNNNFGYSVNYPYQNNQNSYRQHMQSYQNQPFPANGMHEKSEHKPTDPVNLKNIDIPTFIRNQN
jgi:cell division protein FtsZ